MEILLNAIWAVLVMMLVFKIFVHVWYDKPTEASDEVYALGGVLIVLEFILIVVYTVWRIWT